MDLAKFAQKVSPAGATVEKVKFFTARTNPREWRPGSLGHERQKVYWRALRTLQNVEIIEGQFRHDLKDYPDATDPNRLLKIIKTEEKGSDVNLASHLLMDGFRKLYDIAVVVSNDTDFATAVHMVKRDLHLKVGIVAPNGKAHRELQKASSFVGVVTKECLAQAQFPNVLYDSKGLIYRPQVWYKSHEVLAVSRLANRLFEIFV